MTDRGRVQLRQGVIAAKRHIHLTPEDAARFGVKDKQVVKLQTYTARPVLFEEVAVRVSRNLPPMSIWTTMRPMPAASRRGIWGESFHDGGIACRNRAGDGAWVPICDRAAL